VNIQIFGTNKCFDAKKAERYFKERRIPFQRIDLADKGMSRGELQNVCRAVGGLDAALDENCRDQDTLALVRYLTEDAKLDKVLENQQILKTPIVRNGKQATVGYQPDVWKMWE
jgi:arsenate reductase-like glutaredoxin family protein